MFHTLETRLPMCVAGKIGFHHKLSTYGAFPKILHKPTRLQYCPFHSIQIWIILFFAHPGIPSISLCKSILRYNWFISAGLYFPSEKSILLNPLLSDPVNEQIGQKASRIEGAIMKIASISFPLVSPFP